MGLLNVLLRTTIWYHGSYTLQRFVDILLYSTAVIDLNQVFQRLHNYYGMAAVGRKVHTALSIRLKSS